jgi:hypothetical protein
MNRTGIISTLLIGLSSIFAQSAHATPENIDRFSLKQENPASKFMSKELKIPECTDYYGSKVGFIRSDTYEMRRHHAGFAFAYRQAGRPYVKYDHDRLATLPGYFQNHVLSHECAHHSLGHFYRPISDEEAERQADCHALEANGYGKKEAKMISDLLDEMYKFDPDKPINIVPTDKKSVLENCYP